MQSDVAHVVRMLYCHSSRRQAHSAPRLGIEGIPAKSENVLMLVAATNCSHAWLAAEASSSVQPNRRGRWC